MTEDDERTETERYQKLWDAISTEPYAPHYYDRDGKPITLRQWAELREDGREDYIRVAHEDVLMPSGRMVWVSTVWIGLDMSFLPDSAPLIFETMVFEAGQLGDYTERYTTLQQAQDGHNAVIHALKEGLLTLQWEDDGDNG